MKAFRKLLLYFDKQVTSTSRLLRQAGYFDKQVTSTGSVTACRNTQLLNHQSEEVESFAGRALGIEAVSFFLGRDLSPQEKDIADSPTAVRRERPKNK